MRVMILWHHAGDQGYAVEWESRRTWIDLDQGTHDHEHDEGPVCAKLRAAEHIEQGVS